MPQKSIHLGAPARIIELLTGQQKELEVAEIAVTQRVVEAKTRGGCGLQRHLDLRADLRAEFRVIEVLKREQARQPDTRRAVAPCWLLHSQHEGS